MICFSRDGVLPSFWVNNSTLTQLSDNRLSAWLIQVIPTIVKWNNIIHKTIRAVHSRTVDCLGVRSAVNSCIPSSALRHVNAGWFSPYFLFNNMKLKASLWREWTKRAYLPQLLQRPSLHGYFLRDGDKISKLKRLGEETTKGLHISGRQIKQRKPKPRTHQDEEHR